MKKFTTLLLLLLSTTLFAQDLSEGFEDATFPPEGWVQFRGTNNLGIIHDWKSSQANPKTDLASAFVNYENVGDITEDWLVTPELVVSSGNNTLSFWICDDFPSDWGSVLSVKVSTTSQTSHASFSEIDNFSELDLTNDVYIQQTIDLSAYDDDNIYIAFVWIQNDGDNLFLDDVTGPPIYVPPVPPDCATIAFPSDASSNILPWTSLSWSSGGGYPTGYEVGISTINPPPLASFIDVLSATTYTPSISLNPNTTYYWQVIPYNDHGDATDCEIWSFTTGADPTISSIPSCEYLDDPGVFPYGWTQSSTISDRWTVEFTSEAGGYPDEFRAKWVSGVGLSRLISPPIDFGTATHPTLEFKHFYDDYINTETITLGIQTTTDGGATWIEEWSFTNGDGTENIGPKTKVIYLSNYGSETQIAWFLDGHHLYFDYWHIDDICFKDVTELPGCATNIYPPDPSTLIETTTFLEWGAGTGTISEYYLYFGTDNPPSNIENGKIIDNEFIYDPLGDLALRTTSYWQVVPHHIVGPASGCPVWSFTTTPYTELSPYPTWQTHSGTIEAGSVAYFSIDMTAGSCYNFSLCDQDGSGGSFSGDGNLALYDNPDKIGPPIWSISGDASCNFDATTLGTSYYDFSPTVTQTYYLIVEDNSGSGPVTFDLAYQGNYIPLTVTENCETTLVPDFEANEGVFYKLNLNNQKAYNFSTCSQDICPGDANGVDTDFRLYEENGNQLWHIDGLIGCSWAASTYGQAQQDFTPPPQDHLYFLEIHSYNYTSGGSGIIMAHSYSNCEVIDVFPFLEDFSSTEFPPTCWSQIINDNYSTWESGPGYAQCIHWETQDEWLITPEFDLTYVSDPFLIFDFKTDYYWMVSPNNNGDIFCKISLDNGSTWTTIWSENEEVSFDNSNFYTKNIDLVDYTNETSVKIAFNFSIPDNYGAAVYIDNVIIQEGSSCPAPENFIPNGTTSTSATLSWSETGSATTWDLEYGLQGFTPTGLPTTGYDDVTSNSNFIIGGLTPNTVYGCYVRADCGVDNINTSEWVGPVLFWATDYTAISSFPYCESFETGWGSWIQTTGDDFDWTRISGSTVSSGTGPSSAFDGSYYIYTESSDPNYPNKYAGFYNMFNFAAGGLTNPMIEFAYHMYGADMGTLTLQISTDYGISWTDEWSLSGNQGDSWYNYSVDLSDYGNTDNVLLRWWGYTGSSWTSDISLDNICVSENTSLPSCAIDVSPINTETNVFINTILEWVSGGGAIAGYKLFLGTDDPPSNIVNGLDVENVFEYDPIVGLNYSTTYYWQIIPFNSIGDATSCDIWSFTTIEDPTILSFPHCVSFDDPNFAPNGWINEKKGGPSNPGTWERVEVGSYPSCSPHSGNGMAKYDCWTYSSGTHGILATPPIVFDHDNYFVEFWMYRDEGYLSRSDLVNIYHNTIADLTGGTLLGTVNQNMNLIPIVSSEGWYLYRFNMPLDASSNDSYIIFEAISDYGNNIFIDDVCLKECLVVDTYPFIEDFESG
ncbi:MAG: choice-of-anchor J domain-containing protein, partial [Bacteroidales bacterium]|nr:choice-of-anchor J domain-containing protein [Bacteroidales bacterium]